MAKLMAMFPGQGSQYVGMGKKLVEESKIARETFEEAEDAISLDIRKLCFEGPESDLTLTANTQPCILTHSVALWRLLKEESGLTPAGFAGHSLGEYSAVVAAEVINLSDAVKLVRSRGEAMQSAVAPGVGAMAAVLNSDVDELMQVCEENSSENNVVEPVNFNSPQQVVIAGHKGSVEKATAILEEKGARCVPLQVSAPFHSSLMTKAKDVMTPLLNQVTYNKPKAEVFPNLTAEATTDYQAHFLVEQIDHAVKWTQTMQASTESGYDAYIEVGPGKVLFGLARRGLPRGVQLIVGENWQDAIDKLGALS